MAKQGLRAEQCVLCLVELHLLIDDVIISAYYKTGRLWRAFVPKNQIQSGYLRLDNLF